MNKPPDETLKQGRNRSWLLVKTGILKRNMLVKLAPLNLKLEVKSIEKHHKTVKGIALLILFFKNII